MIAALLSGNPILAVTRKTSAFRGAVLTVTTSRGERRILEKTLETATLGDVVKLLEKP
jgi:hypothetical protein